MDAKSLDAIMKAIKAVSGNDVSIPDSLSSFLPFRAEFRARKEAQAGIVYTGQPIFDGSTYLGTYRTVNPKANGLSKIFNVFVAPKDLPEKMNYTETVEYVAGLQNWYGHNGTRFATEKGFFSAINADKYHGGWIIPPIEMMSYVVKDMYPHIIDRPISAYMSDNLFTFRFDFGLKTTKSEDDRAECHYWSSTDVHWPNHTHEVIPPHTFAANFLNARCDALENDEYRLNCRPVRLVEITP